MVFKISMSLVKRPENIRGNIPHDIFVDEYSRAVAEGLVDLRNEFVQESPVGANAELKNSWVTSGPDVRGKVVKGEVSSSVIQAIVTDQGAKPHTPPIGQGSGLNQWVRRKLRLTSESAISTAAFLISRKIRQRGLPKKEIFSDSFKDMEPNFNVIMDRAKDRVVSRLAE